jgi:hypothetical protein
MRIGGEDEIDPLAGLALVLLTVSLFTIPAFSQTATTGAIVGRAADNTGALVPGVEVTISSPAMIGGARSAPTDETGSPTGLLCWFPASIA